MGAAAEGGLVLGLEPGSWRRAMARWYPTAAGSARTRAAMRCRLSPSRYISTHSASGARRNRLSKGPILPRPSPQDGRAPGP